MVNESWRPLMDYFAGSLLNPKIPNGKDNRNKSPFDEYFPDIAQPTSPMMNMSMPRNGAFPLPPILNPSPAYRAFAEPYVQKPFTALLEQTMKLSPKYRGLLS